MAWLAAPQRRPSADRRGHPAAPLEKAASAQPDGDTGGLPAARLDPGQRPPPQGHRRLSPLDASTLKFNRRHSGAARGGLNPESRATTWRFRVRANARRGMTTSALLTAGKVGTSAAPLLWPKSNRGLMGHLTEMGNHRVGSGPRARLPRFAAATDQNTAGR